METTTYRLIKQSLIELYLKDSRPWLVGFSGNSRFGCWTCTVVERDKASEGLLASGDERMKKLIEFRETLLFHQNCADCRAR